MPIFEYKCRTCKTKFERLVGHNGEKITCPDCRSPDVTKLFSAFSARSGDKAIASSCAGCGGGDCASCGTRR
ncbi:MAG: zinc ribbon domain-containing protein [Bacillota bacterium]|nr:zinc ribbon domain-containing protein [Bacillota bacterium]